jgi:hypothetical protein
VSFDDFLILPCEKSDNLFFFVHLLMTLRNYALFKNIYIALKYAIKAYNYIKLLFYKTILF